MSISISLINAVIKAVRSPALKCHLSPKIDKYRVFIQKTFVNMYKITRIL